jgi:hypothetical protein
MLSVTQFVGHAFISFQSPALLFFNIPRPGLAYFEIDVLKPAFWQ